MLPSENNSLKSISSKKKWFQTYDHFAAPIKFQITSKQFITSYFMAGNAFIISRSLIGKLKFSNKYFPCGAEHSSNYIILTKS